MLKIKNFFGFCKKAYENDKSRDHLALRQHFDVSTTLIRSNAPDEPLFVAGFKGDYNITFLLVLMVCSAVCAISFVAGLIKDLIRR